MTAREFLDTLRACGRIEPKAPKPAAAQPEEIETVVQQWDAAAGKFVERRVRYLPMTEFIDHDFDDHEEDEE